LICASRNACALTFSVRHVAMSPAPEEGAPEAKLVNRAGEMVEVGGVG